MADFPKKQQQCLIPKYLLDYLGQLDENHPDPSAEWGGQGTTYTAGDGIIIDDDTISVDDETVAMVSNLSTVAFSGSYLNLSNTPDLSVYQLEENAFKVLDFSSYSGAQTSPELWDALEDTWPRVIVLYQGNYFVPETDSLPYLSEYRLTCVHATHSQDIQTQKETYEISVNKLSINEYWAFQDMPITVTNDYNDLLNRPTIPDAVSGTNDGTNWTSLTIGSDTYNIPAGGGSSYTAGTGIDIINDVISIDNTVALKTDIPTVPTNVSAFTNDAGYITSSDLPTNHVTTDTAQTITGAKTFTAAIDVVNTEKGIKLHSGTNNSTNSKLGFTLFNSTAGSSSNEVGFLESYTASAGSGGHSTLLGYYNSSHDTAYSNWDLGFAYYNYNTTQARNVAYKLLIPNQYNLNNYSTKRYIPIDFTDGTTTVRASADGIINISSLLPTVPTKTSDLNNDSGFITSSALTGYATETWVGNQGYITGITSGDVTTALGYTPGTSNFSGSYTDLTDKPTIPSTATSTSTVTPSTSAFVTGTSTTTETLTFTYTDNTTANITIVTSVTDSTSNAMTGATVSTSTTLS